METNKGPIRLGCIRCDRDDYDGIWTLPDDWHHIDEAGQEYTLTSTGWETHLGYCPECYADME